MVRVHSIFAALSLAALVGGATVKPAIAQSSLTPIPLVFSVTPGGSVIITGLAFTGTTFTSDITIAGLPLGWSGTGAMISGGSGTFPGPLATITAPVSAVVGSFITPTLSFTSPDGGASATVRVNVITGVPEPGAVAFGVIAAGSVLGLVARRRKA